MAVLNPPIFHLDLFIIHLGILIIIIYFLFILDFALHAPLPLFRTESIEAEMEQRLHAKCIRGPQKGTLIPPFRYSLSQRACCCCPLIPPTTVALWPRITITDLPSSRRGSIAAPTLRNATFSFSNGAELPLGPFTPFQRPRVRPLVRVLGCSPDRPLFARTPLQQAEAEDDHFAAAG